MAERTIHAPHANPETTAYWAAANERKLLFKRCQACGQAHFYPRALCPFCFSERTEWQESSGQGTVYSFSVMRRAAAPYVLSYVTLAEGPTMMTNLVDCDPDAVRIGQRVRVVFKASDSGQLVPMFTPDRT